MNNNEPLSSSQPPAEPGTGFSLSRFKKLIIIIVIGLVVIGAGYGGFWYLKSQGIIFKNQNTTKATENTNITGNNFNVDLNKLQGAKDSDQDGLSDQEEQTLGTNPNDKDTDHDGLYDYEEVKVYKTDPKNADSDGDSISDGDEVKNGDNPLGPGKLLDLNKAISNLNTQ